MELPDEGSLELFEQVLAELELLQPEVTSKKMFGLPSLMVTGKPFAGLNGEDMIFKLGGEAYARLNPTFTFKAGMVEGRAIDVKSIQDLATLPSKEEILAKLLYLINAPAQRLLGTINAVGRNLAVVLGIGIVFLAAATLVLKTRGGQRPR